jgi:hypothetical protein
METYILPIILISYTIAIVIYTNKTYAKMAKR